MTLCQLCGELINDLDNDVRVVLPGVAHRACLLREVVGGIGHLEDHARWCVVEGDPDGGRTYRQSAIEVDEWVASHRWRPGD
jgi:hypothetical protein